MKLYLEERHAQILYAILKPYPYSFFAFGSRVTGKHKTFSGLDLFYCEPIPQKAIFQLEEDFEESDLPFCVDLVDYERCDADFQSLIFQHYLCIQSGNRALSSPKSYKNS